MVPSHQSYIWKILFQVFHICDGGRKISFICPNGTIFRQSHLICDWWFRVDCGKSVELYEESAEQLAADQKVYKARNDERERRKKVTTTANGQPEVYALDEPYQKPTISTVRQNNGERKAERNSKRVMDADFSNMYPGRQGKVLEQVVEKTGKLSGANERRTTQTFASSTSSPIIFTSRPRFAPNNNRENFQQAASGGLVNSFHQSHRTQHVFAVDKSLFSTTTQRPIVVTATPITTTPKEEKERQQLAESASFASHRGGRTFADFQNPNNLQNPSIESIITTTPRYSTTPYKVIARGTSKSVEFGSANADRSYKLKKTEERLKYIPFSSTPPPYRPTIPQISVLSTTPYSTPYTSARSRIPIDDVYFTTIVPETSATPVFESAKINMSSNNPDVAISLQELDIHKTTVETPTTKKFTEETRDGLEVPPSSGPSALRSFALYFAGPGDENRKGNDVPFLSDNVLIIPIRQNVGRKATSRPSILQQVDDIVNISNVTAELAPPNPSPDNLPSSLTSQTKNSYNALFNSEINTTTVSELPESKTEPETSTTGYDTFTELPIKINSALQGNDLFSSQSRGIVEPDLKTNQVDDKYSRVAPDLRELAQVFTKALSAYLDDPEAFRRVLSEIRPTEPSPAPEDISASPIEYPSATQEEDEVLDFSDVTKPSKKKGSTEAYSETTTEAIIETTTNSPVEISNFVLPLSTGLNTSETKYPAPETDLTAPYETLDQSQSSYYTPSPNQAGTTNAIAEEINKEFSPEESLPDINSNEAVDSYVPIYGSVDDESRPRYGGFQNNSRANYSPYGSELTTTPVPEDQVTTFNPRNRTSALFSRLKQEEAAKKSNEETTLVKQLNNLATNPEPLALSLSSSNSNQFQSAEKTTPENSISTTERARGRSRQQTYVPTTLSPENLEPNPEEINLELSPPFETEPPQGFFVTYTLVNGELQTKKAETTTVADDFTTVTTEPNNFSTERATTQLEQTETYLPTTISESSYRTTQAFTTIPPTTITTTAPTTTTTTEATTSTSPSRRRGKSGKSLERLMELQETLMFNTTDVSPVEKEKAREMVEETMSNMTMTDMTANTLTKMMELAAKNETYRRLVLLLVNDRSGKNKTVEEARLSLLRALLTPVISQGRGRTTTTTEPTLPTRTRGTFRRGKNINFSTERPRTTQVLRRVTTASPGKLYRKTTARPRIVKTTEAPTTTTERPSTVIGNLGLIRKTIEESKTKEIRVNSLDDAILDSDSRAIELLRSLYSLAARWG